ncbi:hypothetical protein RHSIM_Rhsim01G0064200 [Rhododendron simsii]|uniref:RNase H type-1 domain-containing protein n=1 Tax=Rhododendron simsii TaxID=118357 RepID=A0A834LTU0_RHOSS|nr:hypothetical protein RHSIM_Rhsim01G0064200 [Rhododendron simsii]
MKEVHWQIQNDASVDFWVDKWVPSLPSFCIQSTKPPWVSNNKVADFINPTSGEWRIAKLRQVLSEEEIQVVANIPISKLGGADSVVWGLHPSGKYTVKRGYHKAWSNYIVSKPECPSTSNSPISTVDRAMGAWDEFISATETISSTHQSLHSSPPLPSSYWIPPRACSLKINCDASWSKDLKRGWGGIILRDYRGHLVDGKRFRISSTSAFPAENDNAQLISLSVSELVSPWEALAIISDIRLLASKLRLSFYWTPQEGNEAAHWIASSQASSLGLDWVVSLLAVLFSILCNDALVYQ